MGYYKYCDPTRADIVEHLRIRFTPANEFNDPFECLPDARLIEHAAWQKMIEDGSVRDLLADPVLRARYIGPTGEQHLESEIRHIHRERYPLRMRQMKDLARDCLRAARTPMRILCLSQVAPDTEDALLLWGHYTANHRGFVLTFNESDAWFRNHQPRDGLPHDCGSVNYTNKRPSWSVDEHGNAEPGREFVFTKSLHWAYEKEFRLIRFQGTPGVEPLPVDALIRFPGSALRSITLGALVENITKQRLKAALSRPELAHVTLFQAQIDPDHYRLDAHLCHEEPGQGHVSIIDK